MTPDGSKHKILESIQKLPEDATFEEAIERLCLLAKVERGLAQAESDETVIHSEAKGRLAVTLIEGGRGVDIFPGITANPSVRSGKACLKGTRIDVATVVGALAAGERAEAVEQAYALTREQVLSALRYAFHVVTHLPPAVGEAPPMD